MSTPVVLMNDQEIEQLSAEQRSGFGSLESERGLFPLQALSVRAAIDGLLADVEVCQTFVNVFKKPLEATYIFPLPDRAAVSSFVMKVAGRRIEGELKERELARLDYEKAIQKGHRAAITEEERPNVFSLRVGNIQAGEKAVVRFRMAMPLLFSDGEVTFRFPLVVAPRYIPGIPLPMENVGLGTAWDTDIVPDASRISPPVLLPGFPNPVRLNIQVDLNPAGLPLSDLRASLHNVCVNKMDNGVLRIRLEPGERLNRDFILRYRLGDDAVRTSLLLQPDETNADEGTFTLTLVPPANKSEVRKPRDLVFLLDRSGSMAGWKIVAARRALAAIIDTLSEEDRFNILAFDNTVEVPPGFKLQGLQTATNANRSRSMEWLSTIQARGGTEIYQALNVALTFLTSYPAPREQVLVVITDGQVGDESRILAMLGDRLASVRVFALGIDQAVNEGFLRRMAQLGGGSCEMVESEARLNEVMARIHRYLTIPVITGLQISGEKLDFDQASVTPRRLPDLFAGTPVVIAGRYRGQPAGNITVRGQLPDGSSWQTTAVGATTLNPVHVKTWARNRLRDLEDLYESGAESYLTLEEEILQTSLRFGVLCRFTAFVAVDRSEVVNGDGQPIQFIQPVEAPSGWGLFRLGQMSVAMHRTPVSYNLFMKDALYMDSLAVGCTPHGHGGFLRRFYESLFGADEGLDEYPLPENLVDLSSYRRSAKTLLQLLRDSAGKSLTDRLATLKVLAERLRQLLMEMAAGAVPKAVRNPLRDLYLALIRLRTDASVNEARLSECWSRAERILEEFSSGASIKTESARQS